MALAWNTTAQMPRLRTYYDAAQREANTAPIRGDKQGLKPLGNRSQKWRHIRKEADGTITVNETYHPDFAQPLIRFHPDDTVTILPSGYWNKATGHDIIQAVLGLRIWTEAGASWVKCNGGTFRLRPVISPKWDHKQNKYVLPAGTKQPDNRFKLDAQLGWTYLNPPKAQVHVIDRKGAKAVREQYAAFSQYLSAMTKLRKGNLPQFDEYVEVFGTKNGYTPRDYGTSSTSYKPWWAIDLEEVSSGFSHDQAAHLCELMQSDKPEDQYRAYMWLTFRNWTGARNKMEQVILMHHHKEMLKLKDREVGEKAIDRYKWAIPK